MFTSISAFCYFASTLLVAFWLLNRLLVPKPLPGIPYSRLTRWMPCGDLVTLGVHSLRTGSTFDWLSKQCLKHKSPIVQILVPSFSTKTPTLLIADLGTIKDIIMKRGYEIDRATIIHYWFSVIVPNATTGMQTTPSFKRQRRLFNCMLSPEFLDNVAIPAFEAAIRRSIELWTLKAEISEGRSFAAYEDLLRTTLEGIWKLLLGSELGLANVSISLLQEKKDTNTAAAPSGTFPYFFQDFQSLLTALLWVVTGISPRFYKWIVNIMPWFRTAMKRTKGLLEGIVYETRMHIATGTFTTRCGLSEALQQHDSTVSDESLIDEILELLITGHETTGSTTAWGVKYLADHQEIQHRLYDALKQVFPNATRSELPSGLEIFHAEIPYLDAVIAEILRLACTGPVIFRETFTDCEIMGHHIPANTPVFLITQSPPGYMITPDTFDFEKELGPKLDEPLLSNSADFPEWKSSFEDFIPERWLDNNGNFDPDAGLFLPFSAGKRGCFGKRIAMLELKLLFAMFVLSFRFDQLPRERSKYNSNDSLTRQPACCYVKPVPRQE